MLFQPTLLSSCLLVLLSSVLSSVVHPANAVNLPPYEGPNTAFTPMTERIVLQRAANDKTGVETEVAQPTSTNKKKPQVVSLGIKGEYQYSGLEFLPSIPQEGNKRKPFLFEETLHPSLQSNKKRSNTRKIHSRHAHQMQAIALPVVYAGGPTPRHSRYYTLAPGRGNLDHDTLQDPSMQYRQRRSPHEYHLRRNRLAARQQPRDQLYSSDPSYPKHPGLKSQQHLEQWEYNQPSSHYTLPEFYEDRLITTEPEYSPQESYHYSPYSVDTDKYEQPQENYYYSASAPSFTFEEEEVYTQDHTGPAQQEQYPSDPLLNPPSEVIQEAVCSCISYGDTGGECICPAARPVMYSLASQPDKRRKTLADMFREEHFDRHSGQHLNKRDFWDGSLLIEDPFYSRKGSAPQSLVQEEMPFTEEE